MANPCDQVESYGDATSSVFGGGLTSLIASTVLAVSLLISNETNVVTDYVIATSSLVAPVENDLTGTALATTTLTDRLVASNLASNTAAGQTQVSVSADVLAQATGNATSSLISGKESSINESAAAVSSVLSGAQRAPVLVTEQATATSVLLAQPDNTVQSTSNATSTVIPQVRASNTLLSQGDAASSLIDVQTPGADASSFAAAISSVLDHLAANTTAVSRAEATSELFIPPSDLAWVINTESTAMWRYTDYALRWVTSIKGKVIGLTDAGLCEVQTSNNVTWRIDTGWSDLGDQHKKRLTYTYVGGVYPAMTRLEVGTELSPAFYAYALINGRATIGRGLNSRYWRFRFSGVGAATINDIRSDVAVSARRI